MWEQGCKEALNDRSVHSGQSAHCRLLFTCLWPSHHCHGPGQFNCRAPELVLSVEKVLCFQSPAVCWSAEYVCFSWMDTQGSHPPTLPVCLCLCGYVCVRTYVQKGGGGVCVLGGCYNNKLGSSVTLNSPIFQEESKQNWLLLRACTSYKCMQVGRAPFPQGH